MSRYGALGTVLARWDVSTGAFVTVAQVGSLEAPALAGEIEDTADHDVTWRDGVATVKDVGEVSMTLHFDPGLTGHVALATALRTKALQLWRLTFPDSGSTQWSFRAFVTGFQPMAPMDGKLTAEVSLQGTGEPSTVGDGYGFLLTEGGDELVSEDGFPLILGV